MYKGEVGTGEGGGGGKVGRGWEGRGGEQGRREGKVVPPMLETR